MATFRLTVNGEKKTVEVAPDTPLLWLLRDTLALTGTKFGCGKGLCGVCTVHLEGEPVRSCQIPVAFAASKRVVTIEGLSPDSNHSLQIAWISENVPQCGYCQSGQIMTAAALLAQNSQPTDEEIEAAMAGILCRCGTYQRIRRAIRHAVTGVRQTDR